MAPLPASRKERQFWNKIWGRKPCVYPDKAIPGVGSLKAKTKVEFALGVKGTAEMMNCGKVVQGRNRKCEWWSKGCPTLQGPIDSVGSSDKADHVICICVVAWEDMICGYSLWLYVQVKLIVIDVNRMCCLKSGASRCSKVGPSGVRVPQLRWETPRSGQASTGIWEEGQILGLEMIIWGIICLVDIHISFGFAQLWANQQTQLRRCQKELGESKNMAAFLS